MNCIVERVAGGAAFSDVLVNYSGSCFCTTTLGVKIRNLKVDFKTGGTDNEYLWRFLFDLVVKSQNTDVYTKISKMGDFCLYACVLRLND